MFQLIVQAQENNKSASGDARTNNPSISSRALDTTEPVHSSHIQG